MLFPLPRNVGVKRGVFKKVSSLAVDPGLHPSASVCTIGSGVNGADRNSASNSVSLQSQMKSLNDQEQQVVSQAVGWGMCVMCVWSSLETTHLQ